jgi:hypothetical protein
MIISFEYHTYMTTPNHNDQQRLKQKRNLKGTPYIIQYANSSVNERKAVDHVWGIVVAGIIVASVRPSPSISLNVAP